MSIDDDQLRFVLLHGLSQALNRATSEQCGRSWLRERYDFSMNDIEIDGRREADRLIQTGSVIMVTIEIGPDLSVAGGRPRLEARMDDDGAGRGSSGAVN